VKIVLYSHFPSVLRLCGSWMRFTALSRGHV
jgi:hypothetical protein